MPLRWGGPTTGRSRSSAGGPYGVTKLNEIAPGVIAEKTPIRKTEEPPHLPMPEKPEAVTVIGPDGDPLKVDDRLILGVEKFGHPSKHYRLIWVRGHDAWLCNEKQTMFVTKGGAVAEGRILAMKLGAHFSEVTR